MMTNYGEIPNETLSQYFKHLIGKTFKILPLFEEGSPTLTTYINSYQRELIGDCYLFRQLNADPKFMTLISTVEYLGNANYDHATCKSEVLKCTNILRDIHDRYFGGGINGK